MQGNSLTYGDLRMMSIGLSEAADVSGENGNAVNENKLLKLSNGRIGECNHNNKLSMHNCYGACSWSIKCFWVNRRMEEFRWFRVASLLCRFLKRKFCAWIDFSASPAGCVCVVCSARRLFRGPSQLGACHDPPRVLLIKICSWKWRSDGTSQPSFHSSVQITSAISHWYHSSSSKMVKKMRITIKTNTPKWKEKNSKCNEWVRCDVEIWHHCKSARRTHPLPLAFGTSQNIEYGQSLHIAHTSWIYWHWMTHKYTNRLQSGTFIVCSLVSSSLFLSIYLAVCVLESMHRTIALCTTVHCQEKKEKFNIQ